MVNVKDVQLGTTTRKSFAKINEVMKMPNLIEVQKSSYRWFLEEGLKEVFKDIGEISDYTGNLVLDFVDFSIDDEPKYSIAQCKARDTTYARPLKVRARLVNKETGEIKENTIFMGDLPWMTDAGTFVINGAESTTIRQVRNFLPTLLFLTVVLGLSMKPTPMTFSMFVLIKTEKFISQPSFVL